ncbi:Nuclear pore complex protein Nup160-like protein [Cryptotermes secundus]|uniref:Nuclear pore complex protein Nup160-like protein n=1 Tax=Cryptotermes secundus TaxID=105785 RepID=A0A2J7PQB1_9NEOP|nr:Nuclear pore complex protein Nup160-like protein [Cryptotermes secundus]
MEGIDSEYSITDGSADKVKQIHCFISGGTQSTLQDIKVPERAGGYCYKDSTKHYTRNRFIYWRIYHDVLELVEHSLDVNLVGNNIRYKFQDTPVLEGLTIHETYNSILVLVATVSSVHRLSFPHPDKIHKQEHMFAQHPDLSVLSIFAEVTVNSAKDPTTFHVINNTVANTPLPHTSASWLSVNEEALFALAYSTGPVLLIRMDPLSGMVRASELKQETMVPRFLSDIAGALRGRASDSDMVVSMVLHSVGLETYLFSLSRDGNLRMWSCSRAQCIMVLDMLNSIADTGRNLTQGAQSHVLRKTVSQHDNQLYLGVFLCFASESEVCVLKPVSELGVFKLIRQCTVYAPDQDLVDFALGSGQLWAVWRTAQGDAAVSCARLDSSSPEWQPAILEQPPERDFVVTDSGTDPRQAYISYIFHPGQFPLTVIAKALGIFRRSSLLCDVTVSVGVLKERVCMAVEAEIQSEVQDYELTDDEYLEVANRCWLRFYSCCVQYHQAGARPVGLVLLDQSGVVLVKKQQISLLRPMDSLEHLLLVGPDQCVPQQFSSTPFLSEDANTCADLLRVLSVLVSLENQLPDEVKTTFERELYQLKIPDQTVADIARELMSGDDIVLNQQFMLALRKKLEYVKDIYPAMLMLIEALTLDVGQSKEMVLDDVTPEASRLILSVSHLYSSHLGVSTIAQSLHQIAVVRFSICRNLLLLQQLLLECHQKLSYSMDSAGVDTIRSILLPRAVVLTQAYYVVMWVSETPATATVASNILNSNQRRMAILKLNEPPGGSMMTSRHSQQRTLTLLELFVQSSGSLHAHSLLQIDEELMPVWHASMLTYITLIGQLVWPVCRHFVFPEFLLASCQHLLIQEYVRLLHGWCEWNNCSRKFLLGSALLDMGEPYKAYDLLVQAAKGITTDDFMATKLVPSTDNLSEQQLLVLYYLKVIKMFEQQRCSDCVVNMASTAISVALPDDPNLPTLHSIVFCHHLKLGHHQEAYHSLIANPDAARRKDCLQQLVVTLFERQRLDTLADFPYQGMYEDLERIVESRARSLDLLSSNYYNFLYSFHVKKGNLRKAASVMYEQGMRLGQETASGPDSLHRQAKCYLACLNALRLVDPKYAWIVKPVPHTEAVDGLLEVSPKRLLNGEQVFEHKMKRQVQVLELPDIQKEFELVNAHLRLMKHSPDLCSSIGTRFSAAELVAILTSVGMYQVALKLCHLFSLPLQGVFEGLAAACVKLMAEGTDKESSSAWDWLVENEFSELGIGEASAMLLAWRLLETLLNKYESSRQSTLHKAVAARLLGLGAFLPHWLVASYKRRNPAELLRMLLSAGRLVEATNLAEEYVWAVLGHGKEYFGLENSLLSTASPAWLPFQTLDLLLLELKELSEKDSEYKQLHAELKNLVNYYLQTATRASQDKMLLLTTAHSM